MTSRTRWHPCILIHHSLHLQDKPYIYFFFTAASDLVFVKPATSAYRMHGLVRDSSRLPGTFAPSSYPHDWVGISDWFSGDLAPAANGN